MRLISFLKLPEAIRLPKIGLSQYLSGMIVAIVLAVTGLAAYGLQWGEQFIQQWHQDVVFHVYVPQKQAVQLFELKQELESMASVLSVEQQDEAETAAWLQDWLGQASGMSLQDVLQQLPLSLIVHPVMPVAPFFFADLAEQAAIYGADVNEDERWMQSLVQRLEAVHDFVWLGLLFLALLLAVIVSNTLTLLMTARQDELQLMRLLGASEWFIRLPFMLEGVLIAVLAALLAWLLLLPLAWMMMSMGAQLSLLLVLLFLLFFAVVVGLLGALIASLQQRP